jgi:hypothetical protein
MPTNLTSEQILALAPDASAAQAGRKLANSRDWRQLGQSEDAVWGECQGSGKDPYRVQIDLQEIAFRCSCPSRKFPCKHGLGLLLMLVNQPAAIPATEVPPWVAEWLVKRRQAEAKRKEPATSEQQAASEPKRSAARAKSSAQRETKVLAGVGELERWIQDQIRTGLASVQQRPVSAWESMAARMVDAQAPGLARRVRELAQLPRSGADWQITMLERLASLALLLEGYRRREQLPAELVSEIRSQIGWTQDQDSIRTQPGTIDTWLVLGQHTIEEDGLHTQRTWVWGSTSNQPALLLAFAAGGQPLDRTVIPGTCFRGELCYYAGVAPLRALIKERTLLPDLPITMPGYPSIQEACNANAARRAQNPWLEQVPMPLRAVIPRHHASSWHIQDRDGRMLAIIAANQHLWRLLAISGGMPIDLFGEWDGKQLVVLSVFVNQQFIRLG